MKTLLKFIAACLFLTIGLSAIADPKDSEADLSRKAAAILDCLHRSDFDALANYVKEARGLKFSPYARNLAELSITKFQKADVRKFRQDATQYNWGLYDGIGSEIRLSPMKFMGRFVMDVDYTKTARPKYMSADDVASLEELSAVAKAYPGSPLVYYRYEGSEDLGYKDARELILVFSRIEGDWYLVGIAHSEDTV